MNLFGKRAKTAKIIKQFGRYFLVIAKNSQTLSAAKNPGPAPLAIPVYGEIGLNRRKKINAAVRWVATVSSRPTWLLAEG